jgi:hypothetical protein
MDDPLALLFPKRIPDLLLALHPEPDWKLELDGLRETFSLDGLALSLLLRLHHTTSFVLHHKVGINKIQSSGSKSFFERGVLKMFRECDYIQSWKKGLLLKTFVR